MFPAADREAHAARGPHDRRSRRRRWARSWRAAPRRRRSPGLLDRPGDEGRAAGRDRRPRAGDARARGAAVAAATTTCSTRAAPAAIGRARSTSRRARRSSWRRAACASPSTATDRCRAGRAAPTCSRRSASTSRRRRPSSSGAWRRRASRSSSRRRSIRRCGTPAPARRELGVRTAFNLLGPLTNPAGATRQLVGVPRPEFTELLARALLLLGSERAWVVHGADGIDEISTTGLHEDLGVPRRRGQHVLPASGGRRPAEGAARRARGRRRARERARSSEACSAASAGRRATSCC